MLIRDYTKLPKSTEKFDFQDPPEDPIELAHELATYMIKNNGLGISSTQLGLNYRVLALTGQPILVCFNPILLETSKEESYLEEACLSFPGMALKVKRPNKIRVRYTEPNGNVVTSKFDGMTARIFQHQLDLLDGITMKDRATKYHWEQAKKHKV